MFVTYLNEFKWFIIFIYRSPKTSIKLELDKVFNSLYEMRSTNININLLIDNSINSKQLVNLFEEFSMSNVITLPRSSSMLIFGFEMYLQSQM